jgi:hypothetical protein
MLRDEGGWNPASPRLRTGFSCLEKRAAVSCWSDVIDPCVGGAQSTLGFTACMGKCWLRGGPVSGPVPPADRAVLHVRE